MTSPGPSIRWLLWVHRLLTAVFVLAVLGTIAAWVTVGVLYAKNFIADDAEQWDGPVAQAHPGPYRLAVGASITMVVSGITLWILDGRVDD